MTFYEEIAKLKTPSEKAGWFEMSHKSVDALKVTPNTPSL